MNQLKKNIFYLYLLQFSNYLVPLATLPYLSRVLGPDKFGQIGFAQAIAQFFIMVVDFGFNYTIARKISIAKGNTDDINSIYWNVQLGRAVLLVFSVSLVLIASSFFDFLRADRVFLSLSVLTILATFFTPIWLYQGLDIMPVVGRNALVWRVLGAAGIFFLVKSPDDAWHAAFIQFGIPLLGGLALFLAGWRSRLFFYPGRDVSLANAWTLFKESLHVFSASLLTVVFTTLNPVIVRFISGNAQVGYYVASERLLSPLRQLYTPLVQAYYPRICKYYADGDNSAARKNILAVLAVFIVFGVLAVAGMWLLGPIVLPFLLGAEFSESADIAKVMILTQVVIGIAMVQANLVVIASGRQNSLKWIYAIAIMLHLSYVYYFVSHWNGLGTAIAALITETAITIMFAIYIKRMRMLTRS